MKAINISHPKLKLKDIARSLFLEHGWKMPEGFRDKSRKNPLNYSRAEWQQALRIGRKPDDNGPCGPCQRSLRQNFTMP